MNREELATILFEKVDDLAECKELAEEIIDPIVDELDEKIVELETIMRDSRILKEAYFTAKGKKQAYIEIKKMFEYE